MVRASVELDVELLLENKEAIRKYTSKSVDIFKASVKKEAKKSTLKETRKKQEHTTPKPAN